MRREVVSADGIPIVFEVAGAGSPALVFVHGWSCDRTYWAAQVDEFSSRHQIVTIDLPGHGESGVERRSWTVPAFGVDLVAVLDELGLEDVVMVGHSMGGDVIVDASLKLGNRVRGLVWVDTYTYLTEPSTAEEVERFVAPFRDDFVTTADRLVRGMFPPTSDPALVERIVADMTSTPSEVAVDVLEHAFANEGPVMAALARLDVPVYAINPDNRRTDIEGLARHGVRAEIVPGVSHFLMIEDPVRFNAALDGVLSRMR